jgi:RimJ/RimL family protein N-acetyltransferase
VLFGTHVVLRPLIVSDAPFVARLIPAAGFPPQHLPIPARPDGWQTWVRNRMQIGFDPGAHFVECTRDNQPVGYVALRGMEPINRKAELLFARSGNRRMDLEAAHLLLRFGFETMNLHRICSWVLPERAGLIALLESLGFRREGTARAQYWVAGNPIAVELIGLLRGELSELPADTADAESDPANHGPDTGEPPWGPASLPRSLSGGRVVHPAPTRTGEA